MGDLWKVLGGAATAASFMAPVHALFGIHILRRGLIFIDLAIAQVAALGMALSIAMGNEAESATSYRYSIGAALVGAFLISLSRFRLGRVPHEAIIGIVYVLSTAAAIVVLEFSPTGHGLEELKTILAGNILFVSKAQTHDTAILYGIIFVCILALWKPISAISERHEEFGWKSVLFDFIFYALLGVVVASSVKIAGILVVFAWLVMPAVVAFFYFERIAFAAMLAVPIGIAGTYFGLYLSAKAPALPFLHAHEEPTLIESADVGNWPTGPSIVIALGAIVILAYLIKLFIPDEPARDARTPMVVVPRLSRTGRDKEGFDAKQGER